MKIATCLSGQAPRSIELPCIGKNIIDNIIVPLNSDLYISLNSPNSNEVNKTKNILKRLISNTSYIKLLDVYKHDNNYTSQKCSYSVAGRPQAEGFIRCYNKIKHNKIDYAWIFRTRPDLYIPIKFVSLPHPKIFENFMINMNVNYNGKGMTDTFSILPYKTSQDIYLNKYWKEICMQNCSKCKRVPEVNLFHLYERYNIKVLDLRNVGIKNGKSTHFK